MESSDLKQEKRKSQLTQMLDRFKDQDIIDVGFENESDFKRLSKQNIQVNQDQNQTSVFHQRVKRPDVIDIQKRAINNTSHSLFSSDFRKPNQNQEWQNEQRLLFQKSQLTDKKKNIHLKTQEQKVQISKEQQDLILRQKLQQKIKEQQDQKELEKKKQLEKQKNQYREEKQKQKDYVSKYNEFKQNIDEPVMGIQKELIQQINMSKIDLKQTKQNFNPLLRFLLTANYMNNQAVSDLVIPNSFELFENYKVIFQRLYEREAFQSIKQHIDQSCFQDKSNLIFFAKLSLFSSTDTIYQDQFTYFELQENKSGKYQTNLFDLMVQKNYLVMLSSEPQINPNQFEDVKFKNKQFLFLGLIFLNEANQSNPKIKSLIQTEHFQKFYKNDSQIDVYIHPITKISTFIREYQSILNLQLCEIQKYILQPKQIDYKKQLHQPHLLNDYFKIIKKDCNQSQFYAIQQICLQQEGIALLQGPPGTGKTFTLIQIVSGIYNYIRLSNSLKKHIMICAPSNAAIDEIIKRILDKGLIDSNGNMIKPKLVRIGVLDQTSSEIISEVQLENQVNKIISIIKNVDITETKSQIRDISNQIKKDKNILQQNQLQILYDKRRALVEEYSRWKINKSLQKEKYNTLLLKILQDSDIICCTLSSAGSEKLEAFKNQIDTIIVDESAQCNEPQNLIPFQYDMNKVILIGDPKQLPSTTFSQDSDQTLFNRSLFERILDNGIKPYFLDTQYRMHPKIREFPSKQFYDNRLKDDYSIQIRQFPEFLKIFKQNNMFFMDLENSNETLINKSYQNQEECDAIIFILKQFQNNFHNIGIITPYSQQVKLIKSQIQEKLQNTRKKNIQVNSIDSFQGQEKDLIIISTVRSNQKSKNNIGFLKDYRRMNVALTRAKFALIIIGNQKTLFNDKVWKEFLLKQQEKKQFFNAKSVNEVENIIQCMNDNIVIPKMYKKYNDKQVIDLTQQNDSLIIINSDKKSEIAQFSPVIERLCNNQTVQKNDLNIFK